MMEESSQTPFNSCAKEASRHLERMLGPGVKFRDGQQQAICALVDQRARLLVVQRTGWGKSLVYFIATRILRDRGAGPTFLVSPLLSLMRNQVEMASRIGVRARRLDSSNRAQWQEVRNELHSGQCDLLMVSPERLANEQFRVEILPEIQQGIGMMVIDEAHCISDWGHDFRPDYRRIVQIVRRLPSSAPVLATTATANDRVVQDVAHQLGDRLTISRGALARSTLRLQTLPLTGQTERLAWLSTHLPHMPGSGIIYCLTVRDTDLVARWLQSRGIEVVAYHADLDTDTRVMIEQQLLSNEIKGVAATVALGMGFDKPDLGFVVHYQRPGSLVAYYQQIGRAGRAGEDAFAMLMNGEEDDEIQDYFIRNAFPAAESLQQVVDVLAGWDGLTIGELERHINLPHGKIEQCLKVLEVEGAVVHAGSNYQRTPVPWQPDRKRSERVTQLRRQELDRMREFMRTPQCLMEFVARELDDPTARPCGRCANCVGPLLPASFDPGEAQQAQLMLSKSWHTIPPRRRLPPGVLPDRPSRLLDPESLVENGLALCAYADTVLGELVRAGKYEHGAFDDRLLEVALNAIAATWSIDQECWWVTAVPSLRHAELVPRFSGQLAERLGIPFSPALQKTRETAEQKTMQNSAQQVENILTAFRADPALVRPGPVILVDDMIDSGWTMTVCGARLRKSGSGSVYPFALASFRRGA